MPGKAPALDPGQMLAHRVDLADRGARREQRPRDRLFFREREAGSGRDPVGGRAAGDERQDQIVGAGGIGHGQRFKGRGHAGRVGHGMARFHDAHHPCGPAVAMTGDRETTDAADWQAALVEVMTLGNLGHGAGALASRQNQQASG